MPQQGTAGETDAKYHQNCCWEGVWLHSYYWLFVVAFSCLYKGSDQRGKIFFFLKSLILLKWEDKHEFNMMQYASKKDMLVLPEPYHADTSDNRFGQFVRNALHVLTQKRTERLHLNRKCFWLLLTV